MNNLSFSARSAIAGFRVHKSIERLRKSLTNSDYDAVNKQGLTLLDICEQLHQHRAVNALKDLGACRSYAR